MLPLGFEEEKAKKSVQMHLSDRRKCGAIAFYVIIQCVAVFAGSATVLHCLWSPEKAASDDLKLVCIMYLYDYMECGYKLQKAKSLKTIELKPSSINVKYIQFKSGELPTSTRFTSKARMHLKGSIAIHALWVFSAIIMWILVRLTSETHKILKYSLTLFFVVSIIVVILDFSMAIVYIAHIKQSLTTGMVLRYAGWSVDMKLYRYDAFAGWIPIAASLCWLRGVVFLGINVLCIRTIRLVRKKILKREAVVKIAAIRNRFIPDAEMQHDANSKTLLYRNS